MGRPHRLQAPGAITHVAFRAVHEQRYFEDAIDRRLHLDLCGLVAVRFEWRYLGWCQMGTHGHLVVRTPAPNLSAGMHVLTGRYVRAYNERRERKGALVACRFFSTLIESDAHLLEVFRYLPLNPPRAGLCGLPEEWPWSSYRALVGLDAAPSYLAVDEVLRLFAPDRARARELYADFVRGGLR